MSSTQPESHETNQTPRHLTVVDGKAEAQEADVQEIREQLKEHLKELMYAEAMLKAFDREGPRHDRVNYEFDPRHDEPSPNTIRSILMSNSEKAREEIMRLLILMKVPAELHQDRPKNESRIEWGKKIRDYYGIDLRGEKDSKEPHLRVVQR